MSAASLILQRRNYHYRPDLLREAVKHVKIVSDGLKMRKSDTENLFTVTRVIDNIDTLLVSCCQFRSFEMDVDRLEVRLLWHLLYNSDLTRIMTNKWQPQC